jgi:isoamyl acetate esterase
MEPAKILLLGDSLTQLGFEGWASKLANVYQRRADVINRGCSGYNTAFYRRLPPPDVDNVCLVTIFFGANDASLPAENPHHYVSVPDYSRNVRDLVQQVRDKYKSTSNGSVRILLITPPPLDHAQRLLYQIQRYGNKATGVLERTTENTKLYADACRLVGYEMDVPCLDLFRAMLGEPDYGPRYLNDGLHFSVAGHDYVAEQVLGAIANHFPELRVHPCSETGQWNNSASTCAALTSRGPYHDKIDHLNIDAAFN